MLFSRYGSFAGGIDLPDEKQATLGKPIAPWRRPQRLLVPLAACGGRPARPVIPVGGYVSAGERIAQADDPDGVDVFAPLAGRFAGPTHADVLRRDSLVTCAAMELTELSQPVGVSPLRAVFRWQRAGHRALLEKIARGGLIVCRRDPLPLTRWVARARQYNCKTLVVNAMENQPYVTADHCLLREHGIEVIRGMALLGRAIEAEELILAVDHRRTDEYRELVGPARTYSIVRVALPHKYPTGTDHMLVKVLTRREVPLFGSPFDVGVGVIDAATCFATYRSVACDAPPTGRVVTVAGERINAPGNYWVPYGTPCRELAEEADQGVIHNGPMAGVRSSARAVVGPATDAVLAIEARTPAPPTPCIRCGWCTDHCPARLNVAVLNDLFELGNVHLADRLGTVACVECGVCTYVCPSRLPLSQRVKQLKRLIHRMHAASSRRGA
jgi:electron transport complex protein RnfC